MLHEIVKEEQTVRPTKTCQILGLNASSYRYQTKHATPRITDKKLLQEIQDITQEFSGYGYRRVTKTLPQKGIKVNHKKVFKIMQENHLTRKKRKTFKPQTTDSNHSNRVYPNKAKGLKTIHPNQLWVADITYIRLANGFAYLAIILDVFSRKIVGWNLSQTLESGLATNALTMAIQNRSFLGFAGLIHHSDRGVQYACQQYTALLEQNDIAISMSAKGNPYDNAFAESFNKTIKYEEVYLNEYETFDDALENIERFIEEVYNKKRLHSSIDYRSPDRFEQVDFKKPNRLF